MCPSVPPSDTSPSQSPWRPLISRTPLWTMGLWWTAAAAALGCSCTTGPPTTGTPTPCWTSNRWGTTTTNRLWRRSNLVRNPSWAAAECVSENLHLHDIFTNESFCGPPGAAVVCSCMVCLSSAFWERITKSSWSRISQTKSSSSPVF